jgi:Holliday junction resolvase RusA-like endonuclease
MSERPPYVVASVDRDRGVITYTEPEYVSFEVPGVPVPWMRAAKKGKRHFTPPRMAEAQQRIAYAFNIAAGSTWNKSGMFQVTYEFVLPNYHTKDWDNLAKNLGDALNTLAWEDDAQVMGATVRKVVDPTRPSCTHVTIARVGDWPVKPRPGRRSGMSVESVALSWRRA